MCPLSGNEPARIHRDRGALEALVAVRRHIGQCAGQQRAAQTVADDIGVAGAGRLFDGVERG